ncbi:MAG TPA: hypothetical protein VJJ82_03465 [Candidatus Nanoarchaeia archaeon]|nr:hypothetical protein [Candidatus Nanoarchaeia archaeon]
MGSIPWWAWLGVGAFVAITSAGVGGKLQFFAWVGLLFIAIGIAKIVFLFVFAERKDTVTQAHQSQPQQRQQYLLCPRCRSAVAANDYFCRLCGLRLQ